MRWPVIALLVCLFVAGHAAADDNPARVLLWSQVPSETATGWASQHAPDTPFFAECVNDFVAPHNAEIDHVHWWGTYWNQPRSGPSPSGSRVDWSGNPTGRPSLDCSGSQRVTCLSDSLVGDTTGKPSNVDEYGCISWNESGPEIVYQLKVPFPNTYIVFTLDEPPGLDLDLFLLGSCDENDCLAFASSSFGYTFSEPGTYYLVVDGYEGDAGEFALWIDCTDVPDMYFCIRFYENVRGPSRNGPGEMVYEVWTDDFHEADEGDGDYSYWADIPPFPVAGGQHYWVSFQCVAEQLAYGQWGPLESEPIELMSPYMDFSYLGIPRWTYFPDSPIGNNYADLAFELFADPTPVEASSWTTIKAIYR
ncbi:MAG: hypothetical protein GF405_01770 [Candidatus Eisenbacteria bacterium]|nr:hypothetical protein [Candidatus Eisenbacteria bacterium]